MVTLFKEQPFLLKLWEKAGAQGLLGINTPGEHGGIGADILYAAITWEEQCVYISWLSSSITFIQKRKFIEFYNVL